MSTGTQQPVQTPGRTAQDALLDSMAANTEVQAESRKLYHKLGLWGIANAINQHHGLTSAVVQRQLGAGAGSGAVNPDEIGKLLDTVPFGGSVNITNIGGGGAQETQPEPAPTPPGPGPGLTRPPEEPAQPVRPEPEPTPQPAPVVQPAPQPGSSQPSNGNGLTKLLATGLLAGLAGAAGVGIPVALTPGKSTPAPVIQPSPGINGELELEIPLNVERRTGAGRRTESSSSTTTTER